MSDSLCFIIIFCKKNSASIGTNNVTTSKTKQNYSILSLMLFSFFSDIASGSTGSGGSIGNGAISDDEDDDDVKKRILFFQKK